ncbi:MAG: extracellular solute-binding protein, partial [Candidatus Eremiobacteraeota bacterium]|nr:extracellular solute-binding protein [Candidatus Eremiobacteraeota bacterium]
RKLPAIALPGRAALSDEITYTLAIMKSAPHPEAAQRFADFILKGDGRAILESAGIHYRPR